MRARRHGRDGDTTRRPPATAGCSSPDQPRTASGSRRPKNRITIEKKSSRNAPRAPSVEGGSEVRGSRSAHGLDGPSAVTVRGVFDAEMSSGAVIEVDELNVV